MPVYSARPLSTGTRPVSSMEGGEEDSELNVNLPAVIGKLPSNLGVCAEADPANPNKIPKKTNTFDKRNTTAPSCGRVQSLFRNRAGFDVPNGGSAARIKFNASVLVHAKEGRRNGVGC